MAKRKAKKEESQLDIYIRCVKSIETLINSSSFHEENQEALQTLLDAFPSLKLLRYAKRHDKRIACFTVQTELGSWMTQHTSVAKCLADDACDLFTQLIHLSQGKRLSNSPDPKPAQQIIDEANELARDIYKSHGYEVPKGYQFDRATHPQERGMWNLAAIAYEHIEGTDLNEVLAELEEDERENQ